MSWQDWCWSWLAHSALQGTIVLTVGYAAMRRAAQPARRLRLIQLALVACVLVSCLGQVSGLPHWSLGILARNHEGRDKRSLVAAAAACRAAIKRTINR